MSYVDFRLDHHIGRKAVSPSLKLLDHPGLIDIEPGPRLVNIFRFSNRWRTVDEVEAARLAALAHDVKPHRTFGKPPEPKPVKQPKPTKAVVGRPRTMQRADAVATANAVAGRQALASASPDEAWRRSQDHQGRRSRRKIYISVQVLQGHCRQDGKSRTSCCPRRQARRGWRSEPM